MLTGMTERDWRITLEVFDAVQSSRGEPGHDDRKFLEAIHYFTVHSITWRALPEEFGNWNSVWKRFWRLSRSGVFEAFFQILAECSETRALTLDRHPELARRAGASSAGRGGGCGGDAGSPVPRRGFHLRPDGATGGVRRDRASCGPVHAAHLCRLGREGAGADRTRERGWAACRAHGYCGQRPARVALVDDAADRTRPGGWRTEIVLPNAGHQDGIRSSAVIAAVSTPLRSSRHPVASRCVQASVKPR